MEKSSNEKIVELLKLRYPQKAKLVSVLADMLHIEKESVYRRLKGQVSFTVEELVQIGKHLRISLDSLFYSSSEKISSFRMSIIDYLAPGEADYEIMERFYQHLSTLPDDPDSEFGITLNILPQVLSLSFHNIIKFYLLKWKYQYDHGGSKVSFKEIIIPSGTLSYNRKISLALRNTANSYYIWDQMVFQYLVNDIIYFASIRLVTREEVAVLKAELFRYIDFLEQVAIQGKFEDGKGKVNFYLSSINFESNYCYYCSSSFKMSLTKAFVLNTFSSFDESSFYRIKNWMNSLKRTSTLISETGEMQRKQFFNQQREIISVL